MGRISALRSTLDKQKGKLAQLTLSLKKEKASLSTHEKDLLDHEKARELLSEAGLKTQESLSYHISEITSLALEAVFDDPYTLEVEFIQRRNKTECDLFFSKNGDRISPMDASGGGAVDVASFALRIASWSMLRPKLRSTIILDEPMKNLSKDMQDKASAMLQEVSKKLGIQFIIVTHEEKLAAYADKTFLVSKSRKGVSKVTVIEKEDEPEYRGYKDDGESRPMRRTKRRTMDSNT